MSQLEMAITTISVIEQLAKSACREVVQLVEAISPAQDIHTLVHSLDPDPTQLDRQMAFDVGRGYFVRSHSWFLPGRELVEYMSRYEQVLEIASGTGFFASLCPNVIATDLKSEAKKWWPEGASYFTEVEDMDGREAYAKYKDQVQAVFIAWIEYDSDQKHLWFNDLLNQIGNHDLIVVGEGPMGCNANDEFFRVLDQDFEDIETIPMARWRGLHDRATVYRRVRSGLTYPGHHRPGWV